MSSEVKFNTVLNTDGSGLWSDVAMPVPVTGLRLIGPDDEFAELQVAFDPQVWDISEHGLIYTDRQFLAELRGALSGAGIGDEAAADVEYSEQGMQGMDYVSLDVGALFIRAFRDTFLG